MKKTKAPDLNFIEPIRAVAQKMSALERKLRKNRFRRLKIWLGMGFPAWFSLLKRNRFAVPAAKLHLIFLITPVTFANSLLHVVQDILWKKRIARTAVAPPPVFIIGHWRSGTTLLHELLTKDPRHTYPTTLHCLSPLHYLLMKDLLHRLLPLNPDERRPMDNMPLGWDSPQEDEFALCNLGMPSPYEVLGFPARPERQTVYLDPANLSPAMQAKWKKTFLSFIRQVCLLRSGRIILKSPSHSFRIPLLRSLFPDARFIHIVRNPYDIFPSTVKLWQSLCEIYGFQEPDPRRVETFIFDTFNLMCERVDAARSGIPAGQFCQVRYEDLIRDPLGQVRTIYERLGLGDFEPARPGLNHYVNTIRDYRPNRFDMDPALAKRIRHRWGKAIQRYGYS